MMTQRYDLERGRGGLPGLVSLALGSAVLLGLSSCGPGSPGPAGDPLVDFRPPEVGAGEGGATEITHFGPQEALRVYEELPDRGVHLVFLAGRAATLLDGGQSAWPDHDASRVVVFDDRGVVRRVLQGSSPDGRRLEQPAYVAQLDDQGLVAVQADGTGLRFEEDTPAHWIAATGTGALSGPSGRLASARSVFDIPLQPIRDDAPLFWRHVDEGVVPVGQVVQPRVNLLASLANSGWVAVAEDGSAYFASAVRPEVRRFEADGSLGWSMRWPTEMEVRELRFRYAGGGLTPEFTLVQQAMALGPDSRIYILSPGVASPERQLLLVFEPDGAFLRAGAVTGGGAIYVDRGGHVYVTPPEAALARDAASVRGDFASFDLPALDDGDPVALEELRGRVVVVNFWASWCTPCRQEMPLLHQMAQELDPSRALIVGINEDVVPQEGLDFLAELGGVDYPVLEGRGRQRDVYRYRGLPYTVVLDPTGKIVRTFYGFGSTIEPIRRAVLDELQRLDGSDGGGDSGGGATAGS